MAATVRSSSITTLQGAGTTNATKPAGTTSGDLLVAFQSADSGSTLAGLTAPAGWTLCGAGVDSGAARIGSTKVWAKTAGSSEPASYGFVADDNAVVIVVAVTAPASPSWTVSIGYGSLATASTQVTAPSVTTPAAGSLLLSNYNDVNGYTFTAPAGQTLVQTGQSGTQQTTSLVASEAVAAATATGTRTATMSGSYKWTSASIAISDTASGGGGGGGGGTTTGFELGVNGWRDQQAAQQCGTGNLGAPFMRVEFTVGELAVATQVADYCNTYGIRLQPLIGWDNGTPAPDLTSLATWASTLGPGGSHWGGASPAAAITHIELGNENSMYYKSGLPGDATYQNLATAYGQRALAAAQAINNANPQVGVIVELEGGDSNQSVWIDRVLSAGGQTLINLMHGPVIHLYGPNWQSKVDLNRGFLANWGVTKPYFVTETGISTDNGRALSDNYGYAVNLTYSQAATLHQAAVEGMAGQPTKIRQVSIFNNHDNAAPGASNDREAYFGITTQPFGNKGAVTTYFRTAFATYRGTSSIAAVGNAVSGSRATVAPQLTAVAAATAVSGSRAVADATASTPPTGLAGTAVSGTLATAAPTATSRAVGTAVSGSRATGSATASTPAGVWSGLILVGGYGWSSLTDWATNHPTGWISDPRQNVAYEAHHYWDTASAPSLGSRSGSYQQPKAGGGVETLTYATELAAAVAQTGGAGVAISGTRAVTNPAPSVQSGAAGAAVSGSVASLASSASYIAAPSAAVSGTRAVGAAISENLPVGTAVSGTTAQLAPSWVLGFRSTAALSGTTAVAGGVVNGDAFAAAVSGSVAILLAPGVVPSVVAEVVSASLATVAEQRDTWATATATSGTLATSDEVRESFLAASAVSGSLATGAPVYTQPAAAAAISGSVVTTPDRVTGSGGLGTGPLGTMPLGGADTTTLPGVYVSGTVAVSAISGTRAELEAAWTGTTMGAKARSGTLATVAPQLTAQAAGVVVSGSRVGPAAVTLAMTTGAVGVSGTVVFGAATTEISLAPAVAVSGSQAVALGVQEAPAAAVVVSGTIAVAAITLGLQGPNLVAVSASVTVVNAATPIHPVFVRPAGRVTPQVPNPRTTLLVVETTTGRKVAELPHLSLSWNSPLNGEGKCSATLPIEATLDSLSDQRIRDPRAAARAILSGPYRFSLVPCYGRAALMGGPLLPSNDIVGDRVAVGAAGMERMLSKRVLNRPTGTGLLSDPSRDIGVYATTVGWAIYTLLFEATTTYGGRYPTRTLPVTCLNPPESVGEESYVWESYDLNNAWKAIGELVGGANGPDIRLEPYLTDQSDGTYVYWDLQIGDPYLPVSGNVGPQGPTPWNFAAANDQLSYSIDPSGMASSYFATGDGQDRAKEIARADSNMLTSLGFPVLEEVDSTSSSAKTLNSLEVQNRADALVTAHRSPTDKWSLKVPIDGSPDIGMVRRGDVARIEVRDLLYLDPGYHLRRITDISGDSGRTATLSCDFDDDLVGA